MPASAGAVDLCHYAFAGENPAGAGQPEEGFEFGLSGCIKMLCMDRSVPRDGAIFAVIKKGNMPVAGMCGRDSGCFDA